MKNKILTFLILANLTGDSIAQPQIPEVYFDKIETTRDGPKIIKKTYLKNTEIVAETNYYDGNKIQGYCKEFKRAFDSIKIFYGEQPLVVNYDLPDICYYSWKKGTNIYEVSCFSKDGKLRSRASITGKLDFNNQSPLCSTANLYKIGKDESYNKSGKLIYKADYDNLYEIGSKGDTSYLSAKILKLKFIADNFIKTKYGDQFAADYITFNYVLSALINKSNYYEDPLHQRPHTTQPSFLYFDSAEFLGADFAYNINMPNGSTYNVIIIRIAKNGKIIYTPVKTHKNRTNAATFGLPSEKPENILSEVEADNIFKKNPGLQKEVTYLRDVIWIPDTINSPCGRICYRYLYNEKTEIQKEEKVKYYSAILIDIFNGEIAGRFEDIIYPVIDFRSIMAE